MVIQLTADNFNDVIDTDKLIFIDFWAEWCAPCRMLGPIVEKLAEKYREQVIIGKINVEEQQSLAQHFQVSGIPSIFIIKDKQVIENLVGVRPQAEYEKIIESVIEKAN